MDNKKWFTDDVIKKFDEFLNERELPDSQGDVLVILGAPGSGKGTLSKQLKDNFGINHISTGDLIRKSDDPELKKAVESGNFISDDMMLKMLRKEMKKLDLDKGIIFDGYPRTIKQARKLDSLLGKLGLGLNHAIFMDLPEEKAKERIRNRAKKEGRKDDANDDVIDKRFEEYQEKTFPLVDFYKKSRKLVKIDADLGMEGVLKAIVKKLDLKELKNKKNEKI
jgi:adenylate kinase